MCCHSSGDSSVSSILLPWVQVPSTPTMLLSFIVQFMLCLFVFELWKERKNKQKEAAFRPFLNNLLHSMQFSLVPKLQDCLPVYSTQTLAKLWPMYWLRTTRNGAASKILVNIFCQMISAFQIQMAKQR